MILNYTLLLGCGFIWGSQYLLNKIAMASFSPPMIAAGRIAIGAITLMVLLLLGGESKKIPNSKRSFWQCLPDFLFIGLLEATIPCLLVAWAQHQLPSSVTAILIGTVPLFATMMERLFVKGSTISLLNIVGIFLGLLGIVFLTGESVLSSFFFSAMREHSFPLLPVVALLAAACCFSLTMILIKVRLSPHLGPIHAAQGILLGAALSALPLMLFTTQLAEWQSFHLLPSASLALILLGIFCGGIVYILYVRLINRAGPSFASTCNYLVPPIGAFLGVTFSGEQMSSNIIASLLLILLALWFSRKKRA